MAKTTYMKAKYLALLAALSVTTGVQAADALTIDVHRDANCGCCKKWISHLEANGFKVVDHVESNMSAVKQSLGVAPRLASCHTAVIDGKFVEGHVPRLRSSNSPSAMICWASLFPGCRRAPPAWKSMAYSMPTRSLA